MLFAITASADRNAVQLDIFDRIGEPSLLSNAVSAKAVRASLKSAAPLAELTLNVNSRGGDVVDGLAIFNMVRGHKGHVKAHVQGLAASMASVIAMSADEIVMEPNSFMMIHNPFAQARGDASDLRSAADGLEAMQDQLATIYVERTKQPKAEVLAMMAKETWLTSSQAVKLGFADKIAPKQIKAKAEARYFAMASPDWEHAPEEVRNSAQFECATLDQVDSDIPVEIDLGEQEMDPKELIAQFSAMLDTKLAPVVERVAALETPAEKPDASAQAEARSFELARNTRLEQFISEGKLPNSPEARAFFASQAADAASLAQVCAHYEGQKPFVKTAKTELEAPAEKSNTKLSAQQAKICSEMGWDPKTLFAE